MNSTLTLDDNPVIRPGDLERQQHQMAVVTLNIFNICLGHRAGLYQALSGGRPLTAAEIAIQTGAHESTVRDWLRQQVRVGILKLENPQAEAAARRYWLPPAHVQVLVEWDQQAYRPLLAELL